MLSQTKLINRNKFHGKLRKEKMQDPLKLIQNLKTRPCIAMNLRARSQIQSLEEMQRQDNKLFVRSWGGCSIFITMHNAKQESSGAVCYSTSVRRSWTMQGAALFFPLPPSLSLRPPLPFFVKLLTSLARAFSI